MRKPFKVILWVVGVFFGIIAIMIAVVLWQVSPEQEAKRAEREAAEARFVAVFDSLWEVDMVPVLKDAAIFSNASRSPDRKTVTLTVESTSWYGGNEGVKKEIVGGLWIGTKAIMVVAGGDPDDVRLVFQDKWGERLAEANAWDGVKIHK